MPKQKVLIADDERDIVTTVSTRLKTIGYDVITAMDGEMAIKMAKSELPDLILLDIGMPIYDGHMVARELREYNQTSSIPIIFLTARTGEEDFLNAYDEKVCKYITKPFDAKQLMEIVQEVMPAPNEEA